MRKAEFIFEEEDMVFGNYDIMYPQTTNKKIIRSSFDGGSSLKKYFDHYIQWLISVGFTKDEIQQQMSRYCHYQDEVSFEVR